MPPGAFTVAHASACPRAPGEDRFDVFEHANALLITMADGAGGLAGGARAAEGVVALARGAVGIPGFDPRAPLGWVEVLTRADVTLEEDPVAGETTVVGVTLADGLLVGASSGDSGAWVVQPDGRIDDLTAGQHRKLRLGSGRAKPVPFARAGLVGTLVVATDGLFNYAPRDRLAAVALHPDLDGAAEGLVQLVRLAGGRLQDDVAIVLVRATPSG